MRILFLTNFYPPFNTGGEGESCRQMVHALKRRGHSTVVLTSMHGLKYNLVEEDGISRSLYFEMDLSPWRNSLIFFTQRSKRERHNLQRFELVLDQFKPDIVFIWGMWNFHRSLAVLAETKYPGRVLYRFASYWPTLPSQHENYWRTPGRTWKSRYPKRLLASLALRMLSGENHQPSLKFEHAICVSAATKQVLIEAGIPVSHARIIHTGINTEAYSNYRRRQQGDDNQDLQLLYAGRLVAEKGIETLISAVAMLVFDKGKRGIKLYLAGSASTPGYEDHLRDLITQAGLDGWISFLGYVPQEEMPGLMQKFDVLLAPSTWQEPLSRSVLEGLVSGLVVVATPVGGTSEVIVDGQNGLFFSPGNARELAETIASLAADPGLRWKLSYAGRKTVMERFSISKMMDEIEGYLLEVQGSRKGPSCPRRSSSDYKLQQ